MSKGANPAIGTVPCPWASCKETAEVKKFAHRAIRDTQRRYAGKLFAVCPVHGRFGSEGSASFQEYILENATIWRDESKPEPAAAAVTTEPKQSAPRAQPAQPKPEQPKVTTEPARPKPKTGWGGFFE